MNYHLAILTKAELDIYDNLDNKLKRGLFYVHNNNSKLIL